MTYEFKCPCCHKPIGFYRMGDGFFAECTGDIYCKMANVECIGDAASVTVANKRIETSNPSLYAFALTADAMIWDLYNSQN